MSKKLYEESNIQDIAVAIREKNGTLSTYTTAQMGNAVRTIKTAPSLEDLTASANGTYIPRSGIDGFGKAIINVQPNLGELTVSENGDYAPSSGIDGFSAVHVSVSGGGSGVLISKIFTSNGVYNALLDDNADGYSEIEIKVPDDKSYDAVHIWTKSISGSDAAMYIQIGTYANDEFIPSSEATSLMYNDAQSGVEYNGLIRLKYGNPQYSWTITAINDVRYNDDTYENEDLIASWLYGEQFDGIITCSSAQESVFIPLVVSVNGTFLPQQFDGDAFSSVTVDVSQDSASILIEDVNPIHYTDSDTIKVRDFCFTSMSKLMAIELTQCKTIGQQAFYYCSALSDASFPACETIGSSAFRNCNTLTSVSFPVCETINTVAFQQCSSLINASFPVCETIGAQAFQDCNALLNASFPVCLSINSGAFYSCTRLSSIYFPVCKTIKSQAFQNCFAVTSASFPECISIDDYAFYGCSALTNLHFPVCETIGTSAFANCNALPNASFPACISLLQRAFILCSSLISIYFPVCETIGVYAFQSCTSLVNASFPACETIANYAFHGCHALESIYFLESSIPTLLGSSVFFQTPITSSGYLGRFGSIYVPASMVEAYKSAANWSYISDRITAYTG